MAEIGLTVATGDKKGDTKKVYDYYKKVVDSFKLGKYAEALEGMSCAMKSLKSLGTDLGYEAHELAGDCHSGLGNREQAIRELSSALRIFEGTGLKVGGDTPWGVLYTIQQGVKRADKLSDLRMKIRKLSDETGKDRPWCARMSIAGYSMHCGF